MIAITTALAALLMPVIASAKVNGYKTSATSNLKQTFESSSLYSSDYDDRVPYAVDECEWRGGCTSLSDPAFWQSIQKNHTPSFSLALQPYGFKRVLFRIEAGRGPQDYEATSSSYVYMLRLSSASLQPLESHGCLYFTERQPNFWNGGQNDNWLQPGERWLTLYFGGQVRYALYPDVYDRAEDCLAYK